MNPEITYLITIYIDGDGLCKVPMTFNDCNKIPVDIRYYGEPGVSEFIKKHLPEFYEAGVICGVQRIYSPVIVVL